MKRDRIEDNIREKIIRAEANPGMPDPHVNVLWDRLDKRMDGRPAKRIALGYYWAAAVLLLLICVSALLFKNKNTEIAYTKPLPDTAIPVPAIKENTAPSDVSSKTGVENGSVKQESPVVTKHTKRRTQLPDDREEVIKELMEIEDPYTALTDATSAVIGGEYQNTKDELIVY